MRIVLAFVALLLLATFAPPSLFSEPVPPANARLWAEPVGLDEDRPRRRRLGSLAYLEGWHLRSDDRRFGGISAMHVEDEQVLAVSDAGTLIRFGLPHVRGAQAVEVDPIPEGPGAAGSKRDRDAEAMLVRGGRAWISFERSNSVWRYDRGSWRSEASHRPSLMRRWRSNAGGEAMVRLADGRFLVFSEGASGGDGPTAAALFDGDPAEPDTEAVGIGYQAPSGYRITDAALLPDGRILYLNRRFSIFEGISAKLTIGTLTVLAEGAILSGDEIAHFAPPVTVDNMEALSVAEENGRTIIWIASDDNLNSLQRTLLLKFALQE